MLDLSVALISLGRCHLTRQVHRLVTQRWRRCRCCVIDLRARRFAVFIWSSPDRRDLIAASSCTLRTVGGNEPLRTTCGNETGQPCMPSR